MHRAVTAAVIAGAALIAMPASAQKMGQGGTGVDETTELPRCTAPLGVVALVEEKSAAHLRLA